MRKKDAAETAALRHDVLQLPANLHEQLLAEARAALPRECCGLIEGIRDGDTIEALVLHPARNLAEAVDAFEIDPAEHIRLLRALRGTGREIVGCYHSHPNGRAVPSPRDRARAQEENFVWLVLGLDEPGAEAGVFLFRDGDFQPLALVG